jgi:flavin prenyltransferase
MLKESRRLILVPRETPLHAIHLENMLTLSKLGVRIIPAMPAFYNRPSSLDEMIDFMVGKVLDSMDIEH